VPSTFEHGAAAASGVAVRSPDVDVDVNVNCASTPATQPSSRGVARHRSWASTIRRQHTKNRVAPLVADLIVTTLRVGGS
jgi:hypothetical protein